MVVGLSQIGCVLGVYLHRGRVIGGRVLSLDGIAVVHLVPGKRVMHPVAGSREVFGIYGVHGIGGHDAGCFWRISADALPVLLFFACMYYEVRLQPLNYSHFEP